MSDTSDLKTRVKEHAEDIGTKAADAAKSKVTAEAEQAKEAAAETVQQTADAADAAADEFDPDTPQAQAVQHVADRIEGVARDLRTADLSKLVDQTAEMARRNPLLFAGGAALAGFALARFLKSSAPKSAQWDPNDDPWSHPSYPAGADGRGGQFNG